jgi:hypothetical protein
MMSVLFLLAGLGCAPGSPGDSAPWRDTGGASAGLPVRWVPTAGEPWEDALDGLWWGLAGLGAQPLPAAVADVREDGAGVQFTLRVDELGLGSDALGALETGLAPLRASRRELGLPYVELGRVLQRTLYEPWVYYAVTGACGDLDGWSARLPESAPTVAITDSLLTDGDRLLRFAPGPSSVSAIAWAAEEGEGSLAAGEFRGRATEVLDLMPNGRFRYAVYDASGALVPAADAAHSPAGQPGRCMWCHENHLMTTVVQPEVPGHMDFDVFVDEIASQQAMVEDRRAALGGVVDWDTHAVHTSGEVLVEGFLRAPTARLAAEWSVEPATVVAWMEAGARPLHNEEYPGWGTVWARADADAVFAARRAELPDDHPLAGRGSGAPLAVLPSARELPDPAAAHFVAPLDHACAPTAARAGTPE